MPEERNSKRPMSERYPTIVQAILGGAREPKTDPDVTPAGSSALIGVDLKPKIDFPRILNALNSKDTSLLDHCHTRDHGRDDGCDHVTNDLRVHAPKRKSNVLSPFPNMSPLDVLPSHNAQAKAPLAASPEQRHHVLNKFHAENPTLETRDGRKISIPLMALEGMNLKDNVLSVGSNALELKTPPTEGPRRLTDADQAPCPQRTRVSVTGGKRTPSECVDDDDVNGGSKFRRFDAVPHSADGVSGVAGVSGVMGVAGAIGVTVVAGVPAVATSICSSEDRPSLLYPASFPTATPTVLRADRPPPKQSHSLSPTPTEMHYASGEMVKSSKHFATSFSTTPFSFSPSTSSFCSCSSSSSFSSSSTSSASAKAAPSTPPHIINAASSQRSSMPTVRSLQPPSRDSKSKQSSSKVQYSFQKPSVNTAPSGAAAAASAAPEELGIPVHSGPSAPPPTPKVVHSASQPTSSSPPKSSSLAIFGDALPTPHSTTTALHLSTPTPYHFPLAANSIPLSHPTPSVHYPFNYVHPLRNALAPFPIPFPPPIPAIPADPNLYTEPYIPKAVILPDGSLHYTIPAIPGNLYRYQASLAFLPLGAVGATPGRDHDRGRDAGKEEGEVLDMDEEMERETIFACESITVQDPEEDEMEGGEGSLETSLEDSKEESSVKAEAEGLEGGFNQSEAHMGSFNGFETHGQRRMDEMRMPRTKKDWILNRDRNNSSCVNSDDSNL